MSQFFSILSFEYFGYLKKKGFIVTTILFMVVIGAVLSFPRFSDMFNGEKSAELSTSSGVTQETSKAVSGRLLINDNTTSDKAATVEYFSKAMLGTVVEQSDLDIDGLKKQVEGENNLSALYIGNDKSYYIVKNVTMYDTTQHFIDELLTSKKKTEALASLGVSTEKAQEVLTTAVVTEIVKTESGKDQMQNFFYTYILIFALYMAIMLYGQFVATGVASEKSSRAMELLITSAKPANLMFGKVIGAGLAGLTQMTLILGSAFVFYNVNISYWGDNMLINSIFNMPISILLFTLLFFILGFFIYAFMYGALGSLVSRMEDINTTVMSVTMIFIFAFIFVVISMGSGNVDTTIMKVLSFVPFTSPMAMFVRIAMGEVQTIEIVISVVLLIVTTIGIGFISAAIYRLGVLLYGKPPKISSVLKMLRG